MAMTVRQVWTPDPGLVKQVEEQFEGAINSYRALPTLIAEHAGLEESIRTGGYANRTLHELVQNAADAMSGDSGTVHDATGRVEIVLDTENRNLYCANAGRPFSASGFTSIMHAYVSAKRGDEIGRFGLGFKSVLAVSTAPQVFSRSISFEFNSPAAQTRLAAIGFAAKRFPVLRTATVIDPGTAFAEDSVLAELAGWATTIVKLPLVTGLDRLRREIEEFASEFLLFVSAVREVKLRILGPEGLETSHRSQDFGGGIFKIERPDGSGEEWIVENRMHEPSADARTEVGEAVSRKRVKVTVAVPKRHARLRIGKFWSYFPLVDNTSASALFNAPWSVNDDRTTLLENAYNREILATVAEMFVDLLPMLSRDDDPAGHLDYMPARGDEALSFGDRLLCAHVPRFAASRQLVPNASGTLIAATDLRPLDFAVDVNSEAHRAWISSPNTADDVPHWRCYTTPQRFTRLRQLFTEAVSGGGMDTARRDVKRALDSMSKRGLLTWLREWADGSDAVSAGRAFKFVTGYQRRADVENAKVIPTTAGLRALADRNVVFINQEEGVEIEGAVFVAADFLAQPGVDKALRDAGFRDLDPLAILNARLANVSASPGDEQFTKLWDAVLGLPVDRAAKVLSEHPTVVKVPTRDGGWAWPRRVFDLDESLGDGMTSRSLDRQRCLPDVAHRLGVIRGPVKEYPLDDEPCLDDYQEWVLEAVRSAQGPGERPVERLDFYPGKGPGPFSMLSVLRDAGASDRVREIWTVGLIAAGNPEWTCEDIDTGVTYQVQSPVRWAADQAGLLSSNLGFRPPADVVAPSLVRYEKLLPLLRGSAQGQVAAALELPDRLDAVPVRILKEALEADTFAPSIPNAVLVEFITAVCRVAYDNAAPPSIPARLKRTLEARPPSSVYLATTDEQEQYLSTRQKPYLRITGEQTTELVESVGCRTFEDSFTFSILVEGRQDPERIIDVFTGLRGAYGADAVNSATVARAIQIAKRVTTEDGVEDQSLDFHRDGPALFVRSDADERRMLRFVNEAFGLGLTNAELDQVLKTGLDHRLEALRLEAKAASTDADRLDVYFGPDDLREALPRRLWQALEAQGLVDNRTSVAELFLTVFGSDSVKQLRELFQMAGFPDVPNQWAGGAATISWLRRMGFGTEYAGQREIRKDDEFIVDGAVRLNPLHDFQQEISRQLRDVLTSREANGRHKKAMVELPTGAGKTRVATETVLRLFIDGSLRGPVLWIAQSMELCEQAVQTASTVWRGLADERPLAIGRLWDGNTVHEPDTEFSFIVATDAQLDVLRDAPEYEWLSRPAAVIVDEGHRAGGSERYTRILGWLGVAGRGWDRPLAGLSATPFKGTSESATIALASRFGNQRLEAFAGDAYRQLAARGVLARVKHEVLSGVEFVLQPEERAEATKRRTLSRSVLDRVGQDHERMSILVNHIMGLDRDWPVLVFTPNVLSAQVLAATLRYRGVEAAAVSGQTGRQQRSDIIRRFKDRRIQVLTNCDLLIQGFDAPGVRALYIARPTLSPNAYIQMAGRGLRGPENGGKEECLIVDMADNFGDVSDWLGYREYEHLWKEQGA